MISSVCLTEYSHKTHIDYGARAIVLQVESKCHAKHESEKHGFLRYSVDLTNM